MFNLDKFIYTNILDGYENINENFMEIAKRAVNQFFADKNMFKSDNFKFYYFDDFVFNTNTSKNNYMRLYIEIDQPNNVKAIKDKHFDRKVKDKKINDLHLTLEEIKNGLFEELLTMFDSNTVLWQEKYSINISVNESVEGIMNNYLFQVIPCFKYINENKTEGVIYYNNELNYIEIEYPIVSINNLINKDEKTNGIFYEYLIAFKNMFMLQKKESDLVFEVFESILYNVPNELFVDKTEKTLFSIINFLRNKNLKEYVTIDEQDFAYTSKYKSFSSLYAKHVISQIEKAAKKIISNK